MKKVQSALRKFISLKWYYQLAIALASTSVVVLLVKFLIWIIPIIGIILMLLFVFTDGEIFYMIWQEYKQRNQATDNPLYEKIYHWLTEEGVTELPISTMQFTQGIEFPNITQGLYFVHIEKEINDELLWDFETKVRQAVKFMSNDLTDCVVSRSNREPFLAIKVRLVSADDMILIQKNQMEEDF
jgi:hypothetical protein